MVLIISMCFFDKNWGTIRRALSWPLALNTISVTHVYSPWQSLGQVGERVSQRESASCSTTYGHRAVEPCFLHSFLLLLPRYHWSLGGEMATSRIHSHWIFLVGEGSQLGGAKGLGREPLEDVGAMQPRQGAPYSSPPVPPARQLLGASCLLAPCSFSHRGTHCLGTERLWLAMCDCGM